MPKIDKVIEQLKMFNYFEVIQSLIIRLATVLYLHKSKNGGTYLSAHNALTSPVRKINRIFDFVYTLQA